MFGIINMLSDNKTDRNSNLCRPGIPNNDLNTKDTGAKKE